MARFGNFTEWLSIGVNHLDSYWQGWGEFGGQTEMPDNDEAGEKLEDNWRTFLWSHPGFWVLPWGWHRGSFWGPWRRAWCMVLLPGPHHNFPLWILLFSKGAAGRAKVVEHLTLQHMLPARNFFLFFILRQVNSYLLSHSFLIGKVGLETVISGWWHEF